MRWVQDGDAQFIQDSSAIGPRRQCAIYPRQQSRLIQDSMRGLIPNDARGPGDQPRFQEKSRSFLATALRARVSQDASARSPRP